MQPTLSVCFPVRNAQGHLESQIERVLDVLPELTSRFDVVIVDDGSTDDTAEIAHELSLRYPQIAAVRHQQARGLDAAITTGLENCDGELVVIHTSAEPIEIDVLRNLCRPESHPDQPDSEAACRGVSEYAAARAAMRRRGRSAWVDRLMGWHAAARSTRGPVWQSSSGTRVVQRTKNQVSKSS